MSDDQLDKPEKDPSNASDGDEPLTETQKAEIARLQGEDADPDRQLTRAEAEELIDQLRHRTS